MQTESSFSLFQDSLYFKFLQHMIVMQRHVVGQTTYDLDKVCSLVHSRHNNATIIILINNNYTVLKSINTNVEKQYTSVFLTSTRKGSRKIPHSFLIQMNRAEIRKHSLTTEAVKVLGIGSKQLLIFNKLI